MPGEARPVPPVSQPPTTFASTALAPPPSVPSFAPPSAPSSFSPPSSRVSTLPPSMAPPPHVPQHAPSTERARQKSTSEEGRRRPGAVQVLPDPAPATAAPAPPLPAQPSSSLFLTPSLPPPPVTPMLASSTRSATQPTTVPLAGATAHPGPSPASMSHASTMGNTSLQMGNPTNEMTKHHLLFTPPQPALSDPYVAPQLAKTSLPPPLIATPAKGAPSFSNTMGSAQGPPPLPMTQNPGLAGSLGQPSSAPLLGSAPTDQFDWKNSSILFFLVYGY